MNTQEVEDAVQFAIEDIKESVDLLGDDDYIAALQGIGEWCQKTWLKRSEQIRNAGGRGN